MMDLTNLPETLNQAFFGGTNLMAAQLMLVLIVVVMLMLPMLLLKAKFNSMFLILFIALGILTSVGWVNPMLFIVLLLVVSLFYARQVAEIFGG